MGGPSAPAHASAATPRTGRGLRIACAALGLAFVAYAVSDHPFYGAGPGFGKLQLAIAVAGGLLALIALLPLPWVKRALLLSFSSLFVLAVLELGLSLVLGPRYRPAYVYDETLLFKLAPSRYSEWTRPEVNGGGRFLTRTNRDGYVGKELLPTGSAPRVVVYGDSFVHAFYCKEEDSFTVQLAQALGTKLGTEIEVVNAGVGSYGPDQISLRMETELPKLQPDLVVVSVFGGNDFGDLMRNKMFRVREDGSVVPNAYVLDPAVRSQFETSQRESILVRAMRQAKQGLLPAPTVYGDLPAGKDPNIALVDSFLERAKLEYEDYVVKKNDVVTNTHLDLYNVDLGLEPNGDSARYKRALMDGVLARIAGIAKRANVPLLFLFIPHPIDVVERYSTGRVDLPRYPDYKRENITNALREIAERHGVAYLNLFDVYRPLDGAKLYYHGGDDHWNEAGQRVAAQAMADYIEQHQLLHGKENTK